jgi:thioredoxin-dependent peroxiredoxin
MIETLQEGRKMPAFKAKDQNDAVVSSADFKGKKLVLYFYPQDNTPTCTVQACNIRDNFAALRAKGIVVIGISPDEVKKHKKFEEKFELPFTLIADTDHAIINKFGVWGEKMLYGKKYLGLHRTTFLINEKGIIKKVILKPKSKEHSQEILQAWEDIEMNAK